MQSLVWRTRRTLAGEELGSFWTDEVEAPLPKRLAGRLFPRQPWEATAGLEVLPLCTVCGSSMAWRGTWHCQGCSVRGGLAVDGTSTPSALPREALAGVPIFSPSEGDNSTAARAAWLWSVEALTSFHRRSVAARILKRGTRPTELIDPGTGEVSVGPAYLGQWHEQRVQGQAERFERVASCGTFEHKLVITDESGHEREIPVAKRCDCWRVCARCLNRRKWKLSEGMKTQRELVLKKHYRQTHKRYAGPEGKWSEKLITFTVPHSDDGPAHDARVLVDAWQQLSRRIRRHLVDRGACTSSSGGRRQAVSVPWNRALEIGTRNGEHAHLHVWWFGPFLDVGLLGFWWGQILLAAGVANVRQVPVAEILRAGKDSRLHAWLGAPPGDATLPRGIVDIRTDRTAAGSLGAYAQKVGVSLYVTKGTETQHMEPAHVASIYEVFEGTRAVQWARGWAPPKKPLRAKCVSFRRLTDEEKKRLNHRGRIPAKPSKSGEKRREKDLENALAPAGHVPIDLGSAARAQLSLVKVAASRAVQLAFEIDVRR